MTRSPERIGFISKKKKKEPTVSSQRLKKGRNWLLSNPHTHIHTTRTGSCRRRRHLGLTSPISESHEPRAHTRSEGTVSWAERQQSAVRCRRGGRAPLGSCYSRSGLVVSMSSTSRSHSVGTVHVNQPQTSLAGGQCHIQCSTERPRLAKPRFSSMAWAPS
jgi:hypothetical protein